MIKEPYVSLKEVIIDNPGVANIDESSLLAGVINAPCGPDHLLVQGPKQFLKEFTVGNAIPRDANVTLINAYFCSFFAPILVKRAWAATDGEVPIQMHNFSSMTSEQVDVDSLPNEAVSNGKYLSLKYPVDLTTVNRITVLEPEFSTTQAYAKGDLVWYNEKYYQFNATHSAGAWTGSDADEVVEFTTAGGYNEGDAVLHEGHLYTYKLDDPNPSLASDWVSDRWESADVPTVISSDSPAGVVKWTIGITTPDKWDNGTSAKSADDFGATAYGFTAEEIATNALYVVYWYDKALGANATMDETAGYRLVSIIESGINPLTDKGVYFEDVMDSDEIPFNIVVGAFTAGLDQEATFGDGGNNTDYNNSEGTTTDDFQTAFSWFEENSDVYNISYVSAFGKAGYESNIATDCQLENTRWFYFCDVPFGIYDIPSINSFNTRVTGDSYRTAVVGGWDKNPSVTGWVAPIAPSSLIYQKLYSNKNSNSEFAPLFDMTNGTLNYIKPYKQFTKSDREKLLNNTYPTNWVKYDRTNNIYYMNDNRTHTRKINVMNEEMNVRMVNKIQRDVMLLVQRYKGMLNTVETRLDVVRVIDDYMNRYIMSQNYRPVEYRLVCDATNNTPDIINANKLAIELDVRIQGSIKFINILNKVFPLGVAFEE